jgi:hypothetical protein
MQKRGEGIKSAPRRLQCTGSGYKREVRASRVRPEGCSASGGSLKILQEGARKLRKERQGRGIRKGDIERRQK